MAYSEYGYDTYKKMNEILTTINTRVYKPCELELSDFIEEPEGTEYGACRFMLGGKKIICRNAKITPKKIGQFVTFWQRDKNGETTPFHEDDELDCCVINVCAHDRIGQFVFPKSELIRYGVVSTHSKEGKRGFRVYPAWDTPISKQAIKTQNWQCKYFYEITDGNAMAIHHMQKHFVLE